MGIHDTHPENHHRYVYPSLTWKPSTISFYFCWWCISVPMTRSNGASRYIAKCAWVTSRVLRLNEPRAPTNKYPLPSVLCPSLQAGHPCTSAQPRFIAVGIKISKLFTKNYFCNCKAYNMNSPDFSLCLLYIFLTCTAETAVVLLPPLPMKPPDTHWSVLPPPPRAGLASFCDYHSSRRTVFTDVVALTAMDEGWRRVAPKILRVARIWQLSRCLMSIYLQKLPLQRYLLILHRLPLWPSLTSTPTIKLRTRYKTHRQKQRLKKWRDPMP